MKMTADASPTKRFFIDNLTRDLSLEDAILDLIDNSIDAYINTRSLDVSAAILRAPSNPKLMEVSPERADVRLTLTEEFFEITDKAGGIDFEHARNNVFRLGRVDPEHRTSLGVYGIGLKRALFKIGDDVEVESRTTDDGFRVKFSVSTWAGDDRPASWKLPLERIDEAKTSRTAGTRIRIEKLAPEVLLRLRDPKLLRRLRDRIAHSYTLFLDRYLTVSINGALVEPVSLPLGASKDLSPTFRDLTISGVQVEIIAGLAARKRDEWKAETAGWYVLCNGRVVVDADKTELTGWGVHGPNFASKYRGFLGIAFFFSADPAALPWTTTKRGLNLDSEVYQLARAEMTAVARPVLSFLNNMYPSEPAEEITERRLADDLKVTDVRTVVTRLSATFQPPPRARQKKTTVRVQYDAAIADIKRVQKRLNKPSWGAGAVGRYCLEYFIKMECPE